MDTIMELDDLKQAWQALDKRLEQQNTLNLHLFKQSRLDKMKSGLRPLVWGQAIQIVVGVLLAVFETAIAKMRVFRVPEFLGAALMLALLATLLRFVSGSF